MEINTNYFYLLIVWAVILVFFRINKIWIFYFIWGSIGFTLISVFSLSNTFVEAGLSHTAINSITAFNRYFNIPVFPFAGAGTVLMTSSRISGYTSLEIGTECSGLLECSVFIGLSLFYPVMSSGWKLLSLVGGSIFIYLINLIRIEMIIVSIYLWGRDTIFLAHTVLGRGVFFFMMIALYWFFFTRSTLIFLRKRTEARVN